jgi:hypothetical protein
MSASFAHKARRLPPSLSPGERRKRADRREVIPWRGVEGSWSRLKGPIPSPLPVLLPLEKGLGAVAFVADQSIERAGNLPVPGLSWFGVSARGSVFFLHKARRLPSSLSPRKGRTSGVERKWHQSSIPLPIYPPCPSLSREGTRTRLFRLRGTPSFLAKQDARLQVSPLERGDAVLNNVKYPGEGGPSRPLFLSFSLWRRDSGPC